MRSLALTPLLLAAFAAPAIAQENSIPAQETVSTPASQQGVISYTPGDFADARPNTALDLINRLPGFTVESGDNVRGFAGAAGNVLIDSARPTTKSDSLQDTLARIPINQVERIDLIRGGAPGIDMQGRTVVANVIRRKVDTFQQVVQLNGFWFTGTGKTLPGWSYQATRRSGEHQLDITLSRGISMDDSVGTGWRSRRFASGLVEVQSSETEAEGNNHNARINYKGPLFGGTFSANGLLGTDEFKDESHFFNATTDERYTSRSANDRGEIGLNYTRDLTSNLEIEAIALSKIAFGAAVASGVTTTASQRFDIEAEAGETIGRTVLRYTASPKLSFEGGGEIAFNYREQQVALFDNGAPIVLPSSDVRVEEDRSEVFAQGTWRPWDQLTLEAGARFEQSTITQSGDASRERSFEYPKPRVVATWSPDKENQLRLRFEKEVGQLNFQQFVSNANLGTGVISTGNTDLRPDQTWIYEAAFERRFWDNGALVLTLRHEDIDDVGDDFPFLVDIDDNGDGVIDRQVEVSGPGNIGSGTNDVIDLSLTVPLKKLGIEGGELKIETMFQNSEVRDPNTGEMRRISGQRPDDINISFRQDLPALKLTYGVNMFGGWSEQDFIRTEVQDMNLRTFFGSFIEYKPNPQFTLRAELNNFIPYIFDIERRVYSGSRGTAPLNYVEVERRNSQIIMMLRGRWTIG